MKTKTFVVERTSTGYSAFAEDFENFPVVTTGSNLKELRENLLEASNLYLEANGKKEIDSESITIKLDLPQFFEFYNVINARAFADRIGINPQLLNHYVKEVKTPSPKQVNRILTGLREVGKELMKLELI